MCLGSSANLGSAWLTLAHVSVGWPGALFHLSLILLLGAESCRATLTKTFYGRGWSTREQIETHKFSRGPLGPRLGTLMETLVDLTLSVDQNKPRPNSGVGSQIWTTSLNLSCLIKRRIKPIPGACSSCKKNGQDNESVWNRVHPCGKYLWPLLNYSHDVWNYQLFLFSTK